MIMKGDYIITRTENGYALGTFDGKKYTFRSYNEAEDDRDRETALHAVLYYIAEEEYPWSKHKARNVRVMLENGAEQ